MSRTAEYINKKKKNIFFFLPKNDFGNEKVTNTQIQDCQLKKAQLSLPL